MADYCPMAHANLPRSTNRMSAAARVFVTLIAAMGLASVYALGCATEEEIRFGGPEACIGGRCSGSPSPTSTGSTMSTASGGSDCMGGACDVSFKTDIYEPLLSATGTTKCADALCHGNAAAAEGDFFFPDGDASAARAALLGYQIDDVPYVTCSTPMNSKVLCNMFLGAGMTNKYGKCGTTMPYLQGEVIAEVLTEAQLDLIAEWIACGAPDN
jgi:hypothetical protein